MNRSAIIVALILALAALGSAGCGRVHRTHFVQMEMLEKRNDLRLDLAYVSPQASRLAGRTVLVRAHDPALTIQPRGFKVVGEIYWEQIQEWLELLVADQLYRSRVFADVAGESSARPIRDPDLVVEVALTGWHEGNGWLRLMLPGPLVGLFRLAGTGPAWFQWEGRMIDQGDGALVLAFADARLHPGGPEVALINLRALRGKELISENLFLSSERLAERLRMLNGIEERMRNRLELHPRRRLVPPPEEAAPPPASHDPRQVVGPSPVDP